MKNSGNDENMLHALGVRLDVLLAMERDGGDRGQNCKNWARCAATPSATELAAVSVRLGRPYLVDAVNLGDMIGENSLVDQQFAMVICGKCLVMSTQVESDQR